MVVWWWFTMVESKQSPTDCVTLRDKHARPQVVLCLNAAVWLWPMLFPDSSGTSSPGHCLVTKTLSSNLIIISPIKYSSWWLNQPIWKYAAGVEIKIIKHAWNHHLVIFHCAKDSLAQPQKSRLISEHLWLYLKKAPKNTPRSENHICAE